MGAREELLLELIRAQEPVAELLESLSGFGWDSERPLVEMTAADARLVLGRYLGGQLDGPDLREWAEAVELREDIALAAKDDELLRELLFALGTPEINEELGFGVARTWLQRLELVDHSPQEDVLWALARGDGATSPESIVVESLDNPGWALRLEHLAPREVGGRWSPHGPAAIVSYWRAGELSLGLHTAASLLGRASEPSPSVDLLVRWYLALCDGDWEHTYGATLRLADNAWRAELRSDGALSDQLLAHLRAEGCEIEQVSTEWADEWTLRMELGKDQAKTERVLSLLLEEAVNTR